MSSQLNQEESLQEGLQRVAREQIQKAIGKAEDASSDPAERVHSVRKRLKKVRGALRLVRPALGSIYEEENAALRDAAQELADLRDARVHQLTYDRLMSHYEDQVNRSAFGPIRATFTERRKALIDEEGGSAEERLALVSDRLRTVMNRIPMWELDGPPQKTVRKGVAKTYGRAEKRLEEIGDKPTNKRLHQLRKRVKYHWRHCRLLQDAWPRVMKARGKETKRLADLLGDHQDLAVVEHTLTGEPDRFGDPTNREAFLALCRKRRSLLQSQILPLAERLFAESAEAFSRRVAGYWKASCRD